MAASTDTARKDADTPVAKFKTITVDGLKLTVDPRVISDFRTRRAIVKMAALQGRDESDIDPAEMASLFDLVERVMGESYDDVISHLEEKNDGYVPDTAMFELFGKVVQKLSPNS